MEIAEVKVKYFNNYWGLPEIRKIPAGDWIDLRYASPLNKNIAAGGYYELPLGIGMILPKGYEAHIALRSSTFKTWGFLHTGGISIIDNSYCGDLDEWRLPVFATKNTLLRAGSRICQFRIVKNQPRIEFITVKKLRYESRGGIGSTGTGESEEV